MRRYASIDFLRGLAILLMLFLHIVGDCLNISGYTDSSGNYIPGVLDSVSTDPFINVFVLVIFMFLG